MKLHLKLTRMLLFNRIIFLLNHPITKHEILFFLWLTKADWSNVSLLPYVCTDPFNSETKFWFDSFVRSFRRYVCNWARHSLAAVRVKVRQQDMQQLYSRAAKAAVMFAILTSCTNCLTRGKVFIIILTDQIQFFCCLSSNCRSEKWKHINQI